MRQLSFQLAVWLEVKDGNATARDIFDGHYSRRRYADGRNPALFVGPGEKMVLVTPQADALFIWRKFISLDNQEGVNCAVFRNESNKFSSELILEAESLAWARWPGERLYTYVNARKVKSRNPGYCFLRAGWRKCGVTKRSKLLIFEKLPEGHNPRFCTPSGVAETGRRDGREAQEALARLHSGGSLNRSHAFAAEGGGSFAAPSGARSLEGSEGNQEEV